MDEAIIFVTLISSIFSLIGLITYFNLSTRKMKLESELNLKRFRIGKRYKLKEMEMPQVIESKGLKDKAIDGIIDRLAKRYLGPREEGEEEGEEINANGIIAGISNYLADHPEQQKNLGKVVQQFLGGGEGGKKGDNIEEFR